MHDPIALSPSLTLLRGSSHNGLLRSGDRALLIDCDDTVTPEALAELGVHTVDLIFCTQYRRGSTAGAYAWLECGARLVGPAAERRLFEDVASYWEAWGSRWHIYAHQPGPQVPARPLPLARAVSEGDTIAWQDFTIQVLATPGATDGAVSYRLTVDGLDWLFCGDLLYGPGQLWDVYSLQKGFGEVRDYHGFMGNRRKLIPSLHKVAASGVQRLVPAHGEVISEPPAAIALTLERLETLERNYAAITCLNHYHPTLYADRADDPWRMAPAQTKEPPPFVRRVAYTSFALVADDGATLLIDCGHDSVLETLGAWLADGRISAVEGCWVTHYHDDHVDALGRLATSLGCPILTDQHMAEIVEHPDRFFLPCISPNPAPVAHATSDGETWRWHEFQLTAYHFPGQTYYHSGLLVEGHGVCVFFAGDSGSPTGVDDHCCPNRVLLGADLGFRRCLAIWRASRPDYIFNQHQERAFCFTEQELDYMDGMLAERERLLDALLPWPNANYGLDEHWCRTYPYEQTVAAGSTLALEVHLTNYGGDDTKAQVEPVLPDGWRWDAARSVAALLVPATTDGTVDGYARCPDGRARLWLTVADEAPAGLYVISVRVTWDGRYLGQFRHALVRVRASCTSGSSR
jgi:glyoxylase-like metal-dependent hydrolase (beta-lactamase superfamily II)